MKTMEERFEGLPTWLTRQVINELLTNKYGDKLVDIVSVHKTGDDENKGDHYLSEIIHLRIRFVLNEGVKRNEQTSKNSKENSDGKKEFLIGSNLIWDENKSNHKEDDKDLNRDEHSSVGNEQTLNGNKQNFSGNEQTLNGNKQDSIGNLKSLNGNTLSSNGLSLIALCPKSIEVKECTLNLVIKDMSKGLCEFIIDVNGVENEISMYREILPDLNRLFPIPITSEMFYYNSENNFIILDDISDKYRIANRIEMLDYHHCKLALETLGKFHGASLSIYEKSPKKFKIVGEENMYNNNLDSFPNYFTIHNFKSLIKIMENRKEFDKYVDKIEKLILEFWNEVHVAVNLNEFNVLNHGDFWTTNILYEYNNNEPISCKFVDFQMTRLCSPTMDLYQFITISMRSDVRDDKLDELLDGYLVSLNNTMKELNLNKKLTKEKFNELMEKTKILGLLNGLTLSEIALCDPENPLELSGTSKDCLRKGFPDGNPYEKGYRQKRVQDHIISLLNWFRSKNYI